MFPELYLRLILISSTIASGLNSLSAVAWKDIFELKFHYLPEERKALFTKMLGRLSTIICKHLN